MTERRPHWDDELVYAVIHEIGVLRPSPHSLRDTAYAVIAAVEDWHEKFVMHGAFRVLADRAASAEADRDRLANKLLNEVPDSYIQMKARALDAEAAIQRVRDDIERRLALSEDPDFGHLVPVETLRGILRTLDGAE